MPARVQSADFILIVDDTPTNISVLAQTLKQADLSIRIANDGLSAIAQVKKAHPALILLDVQMPGIDGFETCRRLKADPATQHIPVIFMTALSDEANRVQGLTLGAVDYITKPFAQAEVLARVKVHLKIKQLTDQLSARVKAQSRSLEDKQSQLIEQEKMAALGQLMAGVAHEINNPMACIVNNIEPAKEYVQDLADIIGLYQQHSPANAEIESLWEERDVDFALVDLPKLLDSMALSIERIKGISQSLRSFSRGDVGDPVPFDVHQGLDSTLIILGHRLKASGQHRAVVQVDKRYGNLPMVSCFPSSMNQVFMNVLANALDALELVADPKIEIVTELTDANRVQLEIVDNGPGLSEEARSRLFEPLFTTKPVNKGTGLGLSISHEIVVNKHQGSLDCISTPGQGCRFVIVLPVHPPESLTNKRQPMDAL